MSTLCIWLSDWNNSIYTNWSSVYLCIEGPEGGYISYLPACFRAVFKWLSKVITWLRLLCLVIGLKDSRQFFSFYGPSRCLLLLWLVGATPLVLVFSTVIWKPHYLQVPFLTSKIPFTLQSSEKNPNVYPHQLLSSMSPKSQPLIGPNKD